MKNRWQEESLREMLRERRGVHLTGARQCGKTTLAEFVASNKMTYLTLDDEQYLAAAKNDPSGFISSKNEKNLLIDEIQKAPELLNAIKIKLDHNNSPGQYLITGSSNLHFSKAVKDSLAGRLGRIRLRTFSLGEIIGGKGNFLLKAFKEDFTNNCQILDKREIIHQAFCGGYPEPIDFSIRNRKAWYIEYLTDLLTKDIRDVTEIRKVDSIRMVANWLLSYSSKFFNLNDLCTSAQISKETLSNYISALKSLYIFDEVSAWSGTDYEKIGKRSKYFASDTGLLANILGWNEELVFYDSDTCGKLIETWVYQQLASLAELDFGYEIYQYRDSNKREIDFIVKNADGDLIGIEVKAGAVGIDDFKHLKWFANNLAKTKFIGIVLYSGKDVLSFGKSLYAIPLSYLGG